MLQNPAELSNNVYAVNYCPDSNPTFTSHAATFLSVNQLQIGPQFS